MTERGGKFSAKKKEKKVEGKVQEEKEKGMKDKEKGAKKTDKQGKKPENPVPEVPKAEEKKEEDGGTVEGAEARKTEENGDFKPIELPPFEIVTGERMSPFYFKFQFRNVEYSSGRNKTLLCFRVDLPGSATEPLMGYMEDEHTTAHAEEAFFQQVLPKYSPSQECEVTWYVSCSPCTTCATRLSNILRQHNKLRLSIFCSRLLDWEEPEVEDGLKALAAAGGKLRMMKPADFLHVWETYVEKDEEGFTPWDDCQDNYEYYVEKLAGVLK